MEAGDHMNKFAHSNSTFCSTIYSPLTHYMQILLFKVVQNFVAQFFVKMRPFPIVNCVKNAV